MKNIIIICLCFFSGSAFAQNWEWKTVIDSSGAIQSRPVNNSTVGMGFGKGNILNRPKKIYTVSDNTYFDTDSNHLVSYNGLKWVQLAYSTDITAAGTQAVTTNYIPYGVGGLINSGTADFQFVHSSQAHTIGDGTTSPAINANYVLSGGSFAIAGQAAGTNEMGISFSNAGVMGGTASTSAGRGINFYDYVSTKYYGGVNSAGSWFFGPSSTNYTLAIVQPISGISGNQFNANGELLLKAGTTTITQLNMASGTKKTTMADGDFLHSAGHLYFHDGSTDYDLLAGGYTLPTATTSVLGGVKVDGTSITIASGVISATGGSSSTYTPTLTNTTNVSSSTTDHASYTQIGNIVHVSWGGTITATSTGAGTQLSITIPVSTLTATQNTVGHGTIGDGSGETAGACLVSISSSTAQIFFRSISTVSRPVNVEFDYKTN